MKKKTRLSTAVAFLGLVIVVSNNIVQFLENITTIPQHILIVLVIIGAALADTKLVKMLK